jgi:tRNA (adenine57-N1/adenine58-N1)-methyltransferase
MSLLRAVGDQGRLVSVERREEFAVIARDNVESWFGGPHPAWELIVGELDDAAQRLEPAAYDRFVLDLLAPWDNIAAAAQALAPGGVLIAYVATTTQLSRFVETLRADGRFTEPEAWESTVRGWHVEGLAVRPEHRMVAHTGFLARTRRLAPGAVAPERRRRPAPGAYDPEGLEWTPEAVGERPVSDRKLRRVRRAIEARRDATP